MGLMEKLVRLHQVDSQLRALRGRLDAASRYHEAQVKLVQELDTRLQELDGRRRQYRSRIALLEGETQSLDARIEKFRKDMDAASTNKQYTAVLTELNTTKLERTKIEDRTLTEMADLEKVENAIREVTGQREERVKVAEVAQKNRREREEDARERLAEMERDRASASESIPAEVLRVFDEVAGIHEGEVLAQIEEIDRRRREYACGACNLTVPFDAVSILMKPTVAQVVRCGACGRILYLHDETRTLLTPR